MQRRSTFTSNSLHECWNLAAKKSWLSFPAKNAIASEHTAMQLFSDRMAKWPLNIWRFAKLLYRSTRRLSLCPTSALLRTLQCSTTCSFPNLSGLKSDTCEIFSRYVHKCLHPIQYTNISASLRSRFCFRMKTWIEMARVLERLAIRSAFIESGIIPSVIGCWSKQRKRTFPKIWNWPAFTGVTSYVYFKICFV